MKLLIENGLMYANNLRFCRAEAGNGKHRIPIGVSEVSVSTATEHGTVPMAYADQHGWLGAVPRADIVVGHVVGNGVLRPCVNTQRRIVSLCESAEERGERVTLEVLA